MSEPENTIERLANSEAALARRLMHAIANGKFHGHMMEDTKLVSMTKWLAEPLEKAGYTVDWEALAFYQASKANRAKALKKDPTLKDRAIFTETPKPAA